MQRNQITPKPDEPQPPIHSPDLEVPKTPPSVDEKLKKIFRKPLPDFDETVSFHRGSRSGGVGYQIVAWSFVAAFIDALILFAMSCFFLVSLSLLVKSQLSSVLHFFEGSLFQFGLAVGAMFVWTYMIMLRVFLGYTIGEWACGLRVGSLQQRLHRFYSLKVLARVCLIFFTGLFILPALSLLFGRDLAGHLVRLPLMKAS